MTPDMGTISPTLGAHHMLRHGLRLFTIKVTYTGLLGTEHQACENLTVPKGLAVMGPETVG